MIMIRNNKVLIEDFDNVILISEDRVILQYKDRKITLEGTGLHVCLYSEEQIVLSGKTGVIRFEEH